MIYNQEHNGYIYIFLRGDISSVWLYRYDILTGTLSDLVRINDNELVIYTIVQLIFSELDVIMHITGHPSGDDLYKCALNDFSSGFDGRPSREIKFKFSRVKESQLKIKLKKEFDNTWGDYIG